MTRETFSDNDQQLINLLWETKQLHGELSSLYRTRSNDTVRINTLWREIERREALLSLSGVDVK